MRTRARARTDWRLDVYRTSLEVCSASGESLARFLVPPAERLRLAPDDSGVPVWIDPRLQAVLDEAFTELAATLAAAPGVVAPHLDLSDPVGLPSVDLALLDGRIEPRRLAGWMARKGFALQGALTATLAHAFALVGRAPGGEEAALVALLALSRSIFASAQAVALGQNGAPAPAIAAALLERATADAAEDASVDAQALAAAGAGLRAAMVQSPLRMQRSIDEMLANELNAYRTSSIAARTAMHFLRREDDLQSSEEIIERISVELLGDPNGVEACWIEAAMDLLREALIEPYLCVPLPAALAQALSRVLSDPSALRRLCTDRMERERLGLALSRAQPPTPWQSARDLLREMGAVLAQRRPGEELRALAGEGTAKALALDQARGAFLVAADAMVLKLVKPLDALLQESSGGPAQNEWRSGRRYRIGFGAEPLVNAQQAGRREAHLYVDLRQLVHRVLKVKDQGAAEFLRELLYEPVLAAAAALRGSDAAVLSLTSAPGDSLAFRGEVGKVIELGLSIGQRLTDVRKRLEAALPELLTGDEMHVLRETEEELGRLRGRRGEVEAQLAAGEFGPAETSALEEQLTLTTRSERDLLAVSRKRRERLLGGGLEASLFVSYGAPASVTAVVNESLGSWPLALAEKLAEAEQGVVRSAAVKELREGWSAAAGGKPLAFNVSLGTATSLRLPAATGEALQTALGASDLEGAVRAIGSIFQSLHKEIASSGGRELQSLDATAQLYSEGFAVSGEALKALREAGRYIFLERTLGPREVAPALRARLAFPPGEPLELVLAVSKKTSLLALVFRRVGSLRFAGLEANTDLYELCDPAGLFATLLATQHLPRWRA